MTEPRDENEAKAELEVKTPPWLPGARLALTYRRLWDRRSSKFVAETLQAAGATESELEAGLSEDNSFADLFAEAGTRAQESGDPLTRSLLSQLVAAALNDSARIDETAYVLGLVKSLQPVHIRIIVTLSSKPDALTVASILETVTTIESVRLAVDASAITVESALEELAQKRFANRFVVEDLNQLTPEDKIVAREKLGGYWLAGFGTLLMELIAEQA